MLTETNILQRYFQFVG